MTLLNLWKLSRSPVSLGSFGFLPQMCRLLLTNTTRPEKKTSAISFWYFLSLRPTMSISVDKLTHFTKNSQTDAWQTCPCVVALRWVLHLIWSGSYFFNDSSPSYSAKCSGRTSTWASAGNMPENQGPGLLHTQKTGCWRGSEHFRMTEASPVFRLDTKGQHLHVIQYFQYSSNVSPPLHACDKIVLSWRKK